MKRLLILTMLTSGCWSSHSEVRFVRDVRVSGNWLFVTTCDIAYDVGHSLLGETHRSVSVAACEVERTGLREDQP